MSKELSEIQKYTNENVVLRFMQMLDVSREESELIFQEVKKWLWLCAEAQNDRENRFPNTPPALIVDNAIVIIDEMWHNFICFTKDYKAFCENYLGTFIHHFPMPTLGKEEEEFNLEEEKKKREQQYEYIYEKLGEDTFKLWYGTFADKYTPEYLLSKRLE